MRCNTWAETEGTEATGATAVDVRAEVGADGIAEVAAVEATEAGTNPVCTHLSFASNDAWPGFFS